MYTMNSSDLRTRMSTHARDNMSFIFTVMKSATMAMAGLALLGILGRAYVGDWHSLLLIPFWIVSLMATILTYNASSVFSNLLVHRPRLGDVLIPYAKTPLELLLFALLWGSATYPGVWRLWPMVFGAFAVVSYVKLRHFMRAMNVGNYSQEMRPLLQKIKNQAERVDMKASLISGIVFLIVGFCTAVVPRIPLLRQWSLDLPIVSWTYTLSAYWQVVLALPAFFGMKEAIKTAGLGREWIFDFLDEVDRAEQLATESHGNRETALPTPERVISQAAH